MSEQILDSAGEVVELEKWMWEQSKVFASVSSLKMHSVLYTFFENSLAAFASYTPASAML